MYVTFWPGNSLLFSHFLQLKIYFVTKDFSSSAIFQSSWVFFWPNVYSCIHLLPSQWVSCLWQWPSTSIEYDIFENLWYNIFVAIFGQTRAFCLDGISDHCNFDASLLLLLKRKVFTSSFFWYVPSPWNSSKKRETHSKQKKNIYENRMFFKGYIKIREIAAW